MCAKNTPHSNGPDPTAFESVWWSRGAVGVVCVCVATGLQCGVPCRFSKCDGCFCFTPGSFTRHSCAACGAREPPGVSHGSNSNGNGRAQPCTSLAIVVLCSSLASLFLVCFVVVFRSFFLCFFLFVSVVQRRQAVIGAFVTFNHEESFLRCIQEFSGSDNFFRRLFQAKHLRFRRKHRLRVQRAPNPSDVRLFRLWWPSLRLPRPAVITFVKLTCHCCCRCVARCCGRTCKQRVSLATKCRACPLLLCVCGQQ